MTQKKIGYFLADMFPTAAETAEINKLLDLAESAYDVQVINGKMITDEVSKLLEDFDYKAGTLPTLYSATLHGALWTGPTDANEPLDFKLAPSAITCFATVTVSVAALALTGNTAEDVAIEDVTEEATVTFESSDEAKATVSADGVIVPLVAGETTITATYEYSTGKTVEATAVVTVESLT